MIRTTALCALGGLLLAATSPLTAQTTPLDRDVDFVRKLATELRFIPLAQQEVDRLQTQYRDSKDFKKVFQLGIEVALVGARSDPNREQRRSLFRESLDKSREFIDRYPDDPVTDDARRTYVQACYEFGQFLLDELELARESSPDKVPELESTAAEVFRNAVAECDRVIAGLSDALYDDGSERQSKYFAMRLYKGMLQRETAQAVRADRGALSGIARDTLENLVFDAGEERLIGQRAFFEMSRIGEVLGEYQRAFKDYQMTIGTIRTALDEADEHGVPIEAQELMFYLLQEASDRAAICLFQQGDIDGTLKFIEGFRADLKKYGAENSDVFEVAHPFYGHPVFLTEAQAWAESGKPELVSKALEQVERINQEHENDIIGLRAKQVLEDILSLKADAVSGALLFEVAKGAYQERNYESAIQGFKRAYAAMSEAERDKLGLELWGVMARSFALEERYLEATLAAIHGLESHGRTAGGDPESVADTMYNAFGLYRRDTKNEDDPAIADLTSRVTRLAAEYGGEESEAKLRWREGNNLLNDRKYAEAASTFAKIPKGTPYYEPAQGRIVVCYQIAEQFDKARDTIRAYLDWTQSPENALPGDRSDLKQIRAETVATMAFYDAYLDYLECTGQTAAKTTDATRYQPTIDKIAAFLSAHRDDGANYVGRAYDMMARLYAQLGQIQKAEETYRTLRTLEPNSALVPLLATQIFRSHYDAVQALETEYTALEQRGVTGPEIDGVAKRLEAARRAAVASGIDYLDNASSPQYGVLYNTMDIAADLAKDDDAMWPTVERVGRKITELFSNDPQEGEKVAKFVTPSLGEALLRQRNFRDAVPFLQAAVAARPNDYPVKRLLSLAQGGWFEFSKRGALQEVVGLDQPKEAYERHWNEYRKYIRFLGVEDYSIEWYEFYWECYMFAHRAGAKGDSEMKRLAETLFGKARSIDDFETLRKHRGKRGVELYQLFTAVHG
ncbi:MAG: hypothetical protein IPM29_01000 [Planctomycetes bacterium]|nr:hypothetical protein [Planctomycetota bacterium]